MNIEKILRILLIFCAAFIVLCGFVWLCFQCVHVPERVTVETSDGQRLPADVVGASKLRRGEWQRKKVRLYRKDGEASWTQGDGFQTMGVMRKEGIFVVRPPR